MQVTANAIHPVPTGQPSAIKVSVVIKALNEEANVGRAIESALAAVAPLGGEVIVADSGSADRTLEIARRYPVMVVQIKNFEERRCGVGPQLGYQHSVGTFIYVLDGDMELDPSFLRQAVDLLEHDASIAGVGGVVREMRFSNLEFENRARHFLKRQVPHLAEVDCLTGGGLYRRSAIEDVGYLSDRNLHGFEEYDLGARLRSRGWRLVRLEHHAVDHYSYQLSTYRLLWYRVRAGRLLALGEILRAATRARYLRDAMVELRPIRFALGTLLFWTLAALAAHIIPSSGSRIVFILLAATLPVVAMAIRSGSLASGVYSVMVWHLTAVSLVLGLFRRRQPPTAAIDSRVLSTLSTAARQQV